MMTTSICHTKAGVQRLGFCRTGEDTCNSYQNQERTIHGHLQLNCLIMYGWLRVAFNSLNLSGYYIHHLLYR
jgi:hypothetical protein